MIILANVLPLLIFKELMRVVTDTHYLNVSEIMNNPWVNAYNHPNFVGYTKDQIDEMLMCELEEIYSYE